MSISAVLDTVERSIGTKEERSYFLTHSVRYGLVLEQIEKLALNDAPKSALKRIRSQYPKDHKNFRVLDVGCFPYHIGRALELMGHEVYGIASSHESIKRQRIVTINIEIDKFPFKDNYFDIILCSEVLEHLPQSPIPPLKEMLRVTKIGGHLVTSVPNIARSINRGKLLLGKSILYPVEMLWENQGKGNIIYHRHNHEYTLEELGRVVTVAGWKVEESIYMISYTPFRKRETPDGPILWTGKFLNYLAMLAMPQLRDTLLAVGRK